MVLVSTPENMAIVTAVADVLRNMKTDEVLEKKRLDNLLRKKPHLLAKARKTVEAEQGCIFATIIGVGIKKLDPSMAHTVGEKARVKAAKGLRKAQGQIVGVVRSTDGEMKAQDKLKLTNELNKLGLAMEFCR